MKNLKMIAMFLALTLAFGIQSLDAKTKTKEDFEKTYDTSIDSNGDGKCDKEEWMIFAKKKYKRNIEQTYEKVFVPWDANNDGILTREEYVNARLAKQEKKKKKK
jgi:Ca2+-binding EF-hand superfamily protein